MRDNRWLCLMITFLLPVCGLGQSSPGSSSQSTSQGPGSQSPKTMQIYDVPSRQSDPDETPEEAADFLKIRQITEPGPGSQAVEDFLKKYPNSKRAPLLHVGAVSLYQQLNNYEKIVEHGELALQSVPSSLPVLSALAMAYSMHEETDKAIEYASKAISLLNAMTQPANASDEEAWKVQRNRYLATNYACLGSSFLTKYDQENKKEKEAKAVQAPKAANPAAPADSTNPPKTESAPAAVGSSPTPSTAAIHLAKAYGYLSKAIELEPRYEFAQFQLGIVLARRNQAALAIEAFAKAVALGGGFAPLAKQNLDAIFKLTHKNSLEGVDQVVAKAKEQLAVPASSEVKPQ